MDQIKEIVEKIMSNKNLLAEFDKDPAKAIESVAGVDLPDDVVNGVVAGVKAKVIAGDAAKGLDALKKLL